MNSLLVSTIRATRYARYALLCSTFLVPCAAFAQDKAPQAGVQGQTAPADQLEEVVVTAQKRKENIQDVPMSLTVLSGDAIKTLKIQKQTDYLLYLPSVSFTSMGPGYSHVFFRGISSGEIPNASGSSPTAAMYLNEMPLTTITGELDVHTYDIARVEALAGPQSTLYGSSSEAGTIRILTNKPVMGKTEGQIDLTGSTTAHGDPSGTGEGMVNLPIGEHAAIRMVGWYDHAGGYIDNVLRTETYPSVGTPTDNANVVEKNYNSANTYGGRATLRIELDDNWTIEPIIQGQQQKSHGSFGYDKSLGRLDVGQSYQSRRNDRWAQAGLTIEGKIGSVDLTYAGSYLQRQIDGVADYSDYSYFYDEFYGVGYTNNAGTNIVSPQYLHFNGDKFKFVSQELRFATDKTKPFRVVGGVFYERQQHDIRLDFVNPGVGDDQTIAGHPDTTYMTYQKRVDTDYAAFGEASYDILPGLTVTGGGRVYHYDNTLIGFTGGNFSYGRCFGGATGQAVVADTPCTDVGVLNADGSISPRRTTRTGFLPKANLTYKLDKYKMMYFTYSKGYRAGGINRQSNTDPYSPDFLNNYEFGFKSSWLSNRLRANVSTYYLDWKNVQFSYVGAQGVVVIQNAGDAHVKGIEFLLEGNPASGLTVSTSGSFNDAKLVDNFCAKDGPEDCSGTGNSVLAPAGSRLPYSPKFKGTSFIRYDHALSGGLAGYTGHAQASVTYQGNVRSALRTVDFESYGTLPGYALANVEIGLSTQTWSIDLFAKNVFDGAPDQYRYSQCAGSVCGVRTYAIVPTPRQIGLHIGRKF